MKMKSESNESLEGKFAIPTEKMVVRLNQLLSSEYAAWLTYTHFGFLLRGPYRDSIKKIFDEHAEQELEHANKLALRITAVGGTPTISMDPIPSASSTEEMLSALVKQEAEALRLYRDTLRLCGHNEGLRQNIESIVEEEQEHKDELSLLEPKSNLKTALAYIIPRLDQIGSTKFPIFGINPEALCRFAESVGNLQENEYIIRELDHNPVRSIFDVSRVIDGTPSSICRVVKQNRNGVWSWAESCQSDQGLHISLVKQWEKAGRIVPSTELALNFKNVLDSLRSRGPARPHKRVQGYF